MFDVAELEAEDALLFTGVAYCKDPADPDSATRLILDFALTFIGRPGQVVAFAVTARGAANPALNAALSTLGEKLLSDALLDAGYTPKPVPKAPAPAQPVAPVRRRGRPARAY